MSMQSTTQNTNATDVLAWFDWITLRLAAAAAAVGFRFEPLFAILLVMSLLDVVIGVTSARARGQEVRAKLVREGAWGKLTMWLIAAAGYLFDRYLHLGVVDLKVFKFEPSFGAALCGIFILAEFISALRNGRAIGVGRSARFRGILSGLERLQGDDEQK